jgi:hypothetical protein
LSEMGQVLMRRLECGAGCCKFVRAACSCESRPGQLGERGRTSRADGGQLGILHVPPIAVELHHVSSVGATANVSSLWPLERSHCQTSSAVVQSPRPQRSSSQSFRPRRRGSIRSPLAPCLKRQRFVCPIPSTTVWHAMEELVRSAEWIARCSGRYVAGGAP